MGVKNAIRKIIFLGNFPNNFCPILDITVNVIEQTDSNEAEAEEPSACELFTDDCCWINGP